MTFITLLNYAAPVCAALACIIYIVERNKEAAVWAFVGFTYSLAMVLK